MSDLDANVLNLRTPGVSFNKGKVMGECRTSRVISVFLVLFLVLTGCSASRYKQKADTDVYRIIEQKQRDVFGHDQPFSIETEWSQRPPEEIPPEEIIASRDSTGSLTLDLPESLKYAVINNRTYQTRKENLYLAALALTAERYLFEPRFDHSAEAGISRLSNDERVNFSNRFSVAQLLERGTSVGLSIVNELAAFTTGDPRRTATTLLSVNLVQPLLRGYGADIVAENLTQAERNVIYEIRAFTRYQRTFAVDITSRYYRLLQQQDTVRNEWSNYQNLIRARQRAEALSVDRLPEFQVDQTKQDELRARNRYIDAVEQYRASLDEFKLLLGMPLSMRLSLDPTALAELADMGLPPVPLTEATAIQMALANRLDLINTVDRFDDSKRKILVAADALKGNLDFFAEASLISDPNDQLARFNADDWVGRAGFRFKLPLDKLRERNAYRRTFIDFERQLRELSLAVDEIRDDVRGALRVLESARQNYQIQRISVDLARRRVESANLLLEAGRAETRDLLEAQNAMVQAQNALTRALVDYHLARLGLLRDLGMLDLVPTGLESRLDEAGTEAPLPVPGDGEEQLLTPDELF